jgi:hypothetical protein
MCGLPNTTDAELAESWLASNISRGVNCGFLSGLQFLDHISGY